MKQQIAEQTTQLPSLRIAYKNQTIRKRKKAKDEQKSVETPTEAIPVRTEPLPMFDDYRFKARDYDPL